MKKMQITKIPRNLIAVTVDVVNLFDPLFGHLRMRVVLGDWLLLAVLRSSLSAMVAVYISRHVNASESTALRGNATMAHMNLLAILIVNVRLSAVVALSVLLLVWPFTVVDSLSLYEHSNGNSNGISNGNSNNNNCDNSNNEKKKVPDLAVQKSLCLLGTLLARWLMNQPPRRFRLADEFDSRTARVPFAIRSCLERLSVSHVSQPDFAMLTKWAACHPARVLSRGNVNECDG
jgi:hypothetical protein